MTKLIILTILLNNMLQCSDMSQGNISNTDGSCHEISSKVLCFVLKSLKWTQAVVFYETLYGEQMIAELLSLCLVDDNAILLKRYDLANASVSLMTDLLEGEYQKSKFGIQVLVILGEKTLQLLNSINDVKTNIGHSIHFMTNSQWILLSQTENYYDSLIGLQLRNVLALSCFGPCVHFYTPLPDTSLDLTCMADIAFENISITEIMPTSCKKLDFFPNFNYKLNGLHLNIGVIESVSFLDIHKGTGNATRYTGIIPELVDTLAQKLNFTFTFVQPEDRQWGVSNNGTWNGLMKDLLEHKTDLIAADLTVSKDRSDVVDFVFPSIMIQELGILYRRGILTEESAWFRVFGPLHPYVYALACLCLLVVGGLMLVLDRESNDIVFHMRHFVSVQYVSELMISLVSVITLQGNGLRPRTASSKILVAAFWMFCIVITGTYIGNLTARITNTKVTKPFNNLEELVNLPDWTWGVGGELTADMIRFDEGSVMKKVWKGLVDLNRTDPGILDNNNTFQFARILNTDLKYAYIILDAKFLLNNRKDCAFEMSDNVLTGLPISMAVNKNSPLKAELESVMWGLSNNGGLEKIYEEHYRDNRPLGCLNPTSRKTVQTTDMLGVVLVVLFGVSLATIVLILEKCMKRFNR